MRPWWRSSCSMMHLHLYSHCSRRHNVRIQLLVTDVQLWQSDWRGWSQSGCDAGSFWSLLRAQSEVRSSDSLVEEHVRVGRQHLVQAGFSHRVVRHPQPLRAEGWGRRGRAAAVRDEMSWVHVTVVNQHSRELEKVLCRAGRTDMKMIRGRVQMAAKWRENNTSLQKNSSTAVISPSLWSLLKHD